MDVPGACRPLPAGELSLTFSYLQLPMHFEEIELCLKAEELYYVCMRARSPSLTVPGPRSSSARR